MISPGVEAILQEAGPFVGADYASGQDGLDYFLNSKILVIGAGGLGCELLKSLALNGFRNLEVIDMDTIDVSNLNRQFLFRAKDVGRPKAEVAAEFIKKRIPGININSHCCKIQEMPDEYYKQFYVVIGGLDSLPARYWMNSKLVQLARESNNEIMIPYVDGGTEAWLGHVKVIMPNQTACMSCQASMFAQPVTYQACTLVSTPRKPEHCVAWAKDIAWEAERKGTAVDGDNDEHITWIMNKAIEHAKKFNILDEISFKFARTVVKDTIAAIASTQAIIASMCTTEVLKIITQAAPYVDNNVNFIGSSDYCGVNVTTFHAERKQSCPECGRVLNKVKFLPNETVAQFLKRLETDYKFPGANSLITSKKSIVNVLFPELKQNLDKELALFAGVGEQLVASGKDEHFELILTSE